MKKIRKFARGQECQVRIPGKCNSNPETSCLAHRNGCGWNVKCPDFQGSIICSSCHDVVDGRDRKHSFSPDDIYLMFCDGVWRTQDLLVEEGLIEIRS